MFINNKLKKKKKKKKKGHQNPSAPLFVSHADILSLSPPTIAPAPCILSHTRS